MNFGSERSRKLYCFVALGIALSFLVLAPSMEQDLDYHQFAGPRWPDVATNLAFLGIGVWGWRRARSEVSKVLTLGVIGTALGSAWYHSSPTDERLVWDRIPMTLTFLPLLAQILGVWVEPQWTRRTLWPLAGFGIASVVWWSLTGDLRWYVVAQFGPALILVPAQITDHRVRPLWRPGAAYVVAKLAEAADVPIYTAMGVSGHALKHLIAALAAYWVLEWSYTCCDTESPRVEPPPAATRTGR